MFLLGIRYKPGLRIAAMLVGIWLAATALILLSGRTVSTITVAIDIGATTWVAHVFWKMRDRLMLNNAFSRSNFPSGAEKDDRIVATMNLLGFAFAYFPAAVLMIHKPATLVGPVEWGAVTVAFLFGHLGLLGICLHLYMKIRRV